MLMEDGAAPDDGLERVRAIATDNMACIVQGRSDELRALYARDARVWHSFDEAFKPVEDIFATLAMMKANVASMSYDDVRLHVRAHGWVQEHLLTVELPDGRRMAVPACIAAELDGDGRIAVLREYIDGDRVRAMLSAVATAL